MEIYPITQWTGHRDAVYALAVDAEGNPVSAGGDGTAVAWDPLQPAVPGRALFRLPGIIYSLLPPSPLNAGWLAGGRNGSLHFVNPKPGPIPLGHPLDSTAALHPTAHSGEPPANSMAVTTGAAPIHDLQTMSGSLWSAHGDGRLLRWSTGGRFPTPEVDIPLSQSAIRCIAPHPAAPYLATGSSDGKVRLCNSRGEIVREFTGHTLSVFSLLFLAGGKYLLSGSRDAHLAVWETESGQLLDRFPAHMGTLNHLVHLPEPGLLASAGRDKEIRLWDALTLELRHVIGRGHYPQQAHTHSVNRLLWLPRFQFLVSAGDDRKIRVWQLGPTNPPGLQVGVAAP
jgi:WD40 repeat protein